MIMKRISLLLSGGLFFLILILMSCNQDDIVYSCNEEVNQWAKENLDGLRTMSREDWKGLSDNKKIAAYRAFNQEQRITFWKDKFAEVKMLDWSAKEISHIEKLEAFVSQHPDFFTDNGLTDEQANELDLFFYQWQKDAYEEFGWTKKVCIAIAGTGESVEKECGEIIIKSSAIPTPDEPVKEKDYCHCNLTYDFCTGNTVCEDDPCQYSSIGCGWFLSSSCNGLCK